MKHHRHRRHDHRRIKPVSLIHNPAHRRDRTIKEAEEKFCIFPNHVLEDLRVSNSGELQGRGMPPRVTARVAEKVASIQDPFVRFVSFCGKICLTMAQQSPEQSTKTRIETDSMG